MRIVAGSDCHTMFHMVEWPEGDVLVLAGDLTMRGTEEETLRELHKISRQPHQYKAIVSGNHDFFFDPTAPAFFRSWFLQRTMSIADMLQGFPDIIYLQDSAITLDGVKFYGSPWQPPFHGWAFNLAGVGPDDFGNPTKIYHPSDKNPEPKAVWDKIPDDTQVLITHAPPRGYNDQAYAESYGGPDGRTGCPHLRQKVDTLTNLKLHVFGHIHEAYGRTDVDGKTFANVCVCDRAYQPIQKPMVFDI